VEELKQRGLAVLDLPEYQFQEYKLFPEEHYKDWKPKKEDIELNLKYIKEEVKLKPMLYRFSAPEKERSIEYIAESVGAKS
jgi:hypothetical protein